MPGPQSPLYAAGARMVRTFPIPPLLPGQALAIGVTSYDGQVFYGITADRDLVPDADVLGQCVTEALDRAARHRDRRPAEDPARPAQEDRSEAVTRVYLPTTLAGPGQAPRRRVAARVGASATSPTATARSRSTPR